MKTLIKSIFVLTILSLLFTSCQKDELQPCNCGVIVEIDSTQIHGIPEINQYPSKTLSSVGYGPFPYDPSKWFIKVKIKNEINDNIQDFYFINDEFMFVSSYTYSPSSIGYLTVLDWGDSVLQTSYSNVIGKRYCVYNKSSYQNWDQPSTESIFW